MKQWLNDNKIYFEIVSTLVFGLASILVAFAANNVSQSQLEIAKIQLEPHIFVGEKFLLDEAEIATETLLEVNNELCPKVGDGLIRRRFEFV